MGEYMPQSGYPATAKESTKRTSTFPFFNVKIKIIIIKKRAKEQRS
jgi:hypothetical protein